VRTDPVVPYPIVADEQKLLESVRTLLEEEPYVAPPSESDIVNELVRLRDDMPTAKEEDVPALMQQYNQHHAWLEQVRAARQRASVDPDSPYFAHLRLTEDGRERDVFLGKATRIARGIRIVDWRNAPISRLFYAYRQGDDYEEELGEQVHTGEILARRTVTIRRGELERIDAPEGIFSADPTADGGWRTVAHELPRLAGGEGLAARSHAPGQGTERRLGTDLEGNRRRQDKRLPDIAGLIDPEQFALITRPSAGFVVIRGTAGSGKTTVALHRIAWLAYEDVEVDSERTLFVVFSEALREYVSHVLPALGVSRVQIRDFRDWAAEQRRRHFPALPRAAREDTPGVVVRLKLHPVVLDVLARQVSRVPGPATPDQALDDFVSALTDEELLAEVVGEKAPSAFTAADLNRVATWCRQRLDEVARHLEGDREADAMLDVEDDALLLYAWQLRVGPLRKRTGVPLRYRHVAIDEVQDFSPLEVRVLLGCLDEHRSITLAGDTQQHVMKDAGFTSWSEFFAHLGLEGVAVDTLRVAYRSSRQIVEFALAVLDDLVEDEKPPIVTRSGPAVELFRFTDHGAAVAFLADALKDLLDDEPLASVALLTADATVSATYVEGLEKADVPRLRRVVGSAFSFSPGVEVTEVANVKGLEFDYVVLVEVSAHHWPDSPPARRLLHVGATRAVHQLWLTSVGAPSPILAGTLSPEE
jgi:DNA helicase-2/ATP-dependent DNA helicase PcrA